MRIYSNGRITIEKKSINEIAFIILLCFTWSSDLFRIGFTGILGYIIDSGRTVDNIADSIIIISFILSFNFFRESLKKIHFIVFIGFVSVYFISGMLHPMTQEYLFNEDNIHYIVIQNMPFILLAPALSEKYIDKLYHISFLSIYLFMIFSFVFKKVKMDNGSDMGSAYALLHHLALVVVYNMKKPNVYGLVTIAIGIVVLIGIGSRGPVGILFLLIAYSYIKQFKDSKGEKLAFQIILILVCILLYVNLQNILEFISTVFESIGLSDRVVSAFIHSNLSDGNGREFIWNYLNRKLEINPKGYGLGYDRLFDFSYSHNFKLELTLSFGVVAGNILFAVFLAFFLYGILFEKREKNSMLNTACFFVFFLKLFVSSSFLLEKGFFFLVGLSLSTLDYNIHNHKKAINNKYYKSPPPNNSGEVPFDI